MENDEKPAETRQTHVFRWKRRCGNSSNVIVVVLMMTKTIKSNQIRTSLEHASGWYSTRKWCEHSVDFAACRGKRSTKKVSTGSPWSNRINLVAKLKLGSRIQVACCKQHQYPKIHHFCAIKTLPHPLSLALINRKKIVITIDNNNNNKNSNNNNNNHSWIFPSFTSIPPPVPTFSDASQRSQLSRSKHCTKASTVGPAQVSRAAWRTEAKPRKSQDVSWENLGKTMGKPWENHGKMVIYMEYHHF